MFRKYDFELSRYRLYHLGHYIILRFFSPGWGPGYPTKVHRLCNDNLTPFDSCIYFHYISIFEQSQKASENRQSVNKREFHFESPWKHLVMGSRLTHIFEGPYAINWTENGPEIDLKGFNDFRREDAFPYYMAHISWKCAYRIAHI